MEKQCKKFAEQAATAIAKMALNNLKRKGVEIIDFECYISYNYEDVILNDIALEVNITGEDPIKLSLFTYIRHTPAGETIGVIKDKKLLKLAEITEYKFPIDIQKLMIEYTLFDLTYKENSRNLE